MVYAMVGVAGTVLCAWIATRQKLNKEKRDTLKAWEKAANSLVKHRGAD